MGLLSKRGRAYYRVGVLVREVWLNRVGLLSKRQDLLQGRGAGVRGVA